jgi:voltage-gated sodium channel
MAAELNRLSSLHGAVRRCVDAPLFQHSIVALVIVNAITLGLETFPAVMARAGGALVALDRCLLAIFVLELGMKIAAYGRSFFKSGWNLFDLGVIAIALVPASGSLAVFRALRVLRLLRLVSAIPKMRFMAESLMRSMPGLGSIGTLLLIFFYVFGVVATKLFGDDFPQWFGSLWLSMFSLFQIMTLEGWADIAREVMAAYAGAWLFFIVFILLATFTVLNLFIGLIVKVMDEPGSGSDDDPREVARQLAALRGEIAALRGVLAERTVGAARSDCPHCNAQ